MHIAIAFDRNYINPFYALLTSLLTTSRSTLYFHVIASGLSEQEKEKITQHVGVGGNTISFYTIDEALTNRFVLINKWTMAVYYRLFFPLLIPSHVERLLYLDTDTIVLKDLQELYNLQLEGRPLGAVYDNYVGTQPLLGIMQEGQYFNSGVLLIDVPKWRSEKISERVIGYLLQFPETIRYVDQCALNAVLKNQWQKLDYKYNVLFSYIPAGISRKQLRLFLSDKHIVHFTLERPWDMLCKNRLRYLFFYYIKKSKMEFAWLYPDFQWKKIPEWVKIRMVELYFDLPIVQKVWRFIKLN